MTGYTKQILEYASNESYVGELPGAEGVGEVGLDDDKKGSRIAVRFFLKTSCQQITAVRFQVFGCGYTIAACSAAAELAENALVTEVLQIGREAIEKKLGGLPEERSYCADLAVEALRLAVASIQQKGDRVAGRVVLQRPHSAPRVSVDHPRYRALMDSPCPPEVSFDDRHLLACLLVVAEQEGEQPAACLGLTAEQFLQLYGRFFPNLCFDAKLGKSTSCAVTAGDSELVALLRKYVPVQADEESRLVAISLTRILAARSEQPGHLWVAMGLFERAQLSAAIRRHLPELIAANHQGMRWKRFFYRNLCELTGGSLCKAPVCGECSEYPLCFAPE